MQEKYGTRFFSPLLPGFSKKLLIPQELATNICIGKNRKTSTIVTSGKIWHVELDKEREDYYIRGKGWENFVKAHGLKDYDMLVFRYHGNMVFTLRVFDKITCREKIYPYGSHTGGKENMIVSDHDDDQNSNIVQKSTKSPCKKRKVHESVHTQISEDSITVRSQDHVPAEMERNCSRKLSFEKTLKAYHVATRMGIPSEFIESSGLLSEHGELLLNDPKGQTWHVGLSKCKYSGTVYISKGWTKFARQTNLKEGDRCIFELLASSQGKKRLMNVRILNHTPSGQIDGEMPKSSSMNLRTNPDLKLSKAPEDHNTMETITTGAHFETTISAYQVTTSHSLYIPTWFGKSAGLDKMCEVTLIGPDGQRLAVGLIHSYQERDRKINTYMTRSWRQFVVSNHLQEGDKCVFELLPEESSLKTVLQVHILKR